jgi:hypothetical protein
MWGWEPLNRFSQNIHPAKLDWNKNPLYRKKEQAITAAIRLFPQGVIIDEERSARRAAKPRRRR